MLPFRLSQPWPHILPPGSVLHSSTGRPEQEQPEIGEAPALKRGHSGLTILPSVSPAGSESASPAGSDPRRTRAKRGPRRSKAGCERTVRRAGAGRAWVGRRVGATTCRGVRAARHLAAASEGRGPLPGAGLGVLPALPRPPLRPPAHPRAPPPPPSVRGRAGPDRRGRSGRQPEPGRGARRPPADAPTRPPGLFMTPRRHEGGAAGDRRAAGLVVAATPAA